MKSLFLKKINEEYDYYSKSDFGRSDLKNALFSDVVFYSGFITLIIMIFVGNFALKIGEYFNDIKNENLTYKIISKTLNKLNSNSIEELDNLEKMLVSYTDDYSNDEINFIKEYKHFKKMTTIFENKMSSSEKEEYQKIKHYILESESKMIMKDSIKYMRDFSYKLNENYN